MSQCDPCKQETLLRTYGLGKPHWMARKHSLNSFSLSLLVFLLLLGFFLLLFLLLFGFLLLERSAFRHLHFAVILAQTIARFQTSQTNQQSATRARQQAMGWALGHLRLQHHAFVLGLLLSGQSSDPRMLCQLFHRPTILRLEAQAAADEVLGTIRDLQRSSKVRRRR